MRTYNPFRLDQEYSVIDMIEEAANEIISNEIDSGKYIGSQAEASDLARLIAKRTLKLIDSSTAE